MKNLIRTIVLISIGVIAFSFWYYQTYSMYEATAFEINASDKSQKVLIATQGSKFKDKLTKEVVDDLTNDSTFIKVMDISGLREIDYPNWDCIILIHTWEGWRPPIEVTDFLSTYRDMSKVIVFTTSGDGGETPPEIDGISGASIMKKRHIFRSKIVEKAEKVLAKIK